MRQMLQKLCDSEHVFRRSIGSMEEKRAPTGGKSREGVGAGLPGAAGAVVHPNWLARLLADLAEWDVATLPARERLYPAGGSILQF
ncbi:hypothetical protein ColTof4_07000 [Colletotrichum tofieldiae]|nr:hypothetical protein ColTof3_11944 [Colletotrichum tofieldiae]GKT74577.1 hypothetical protein ColTof4_07000 [Colletotrichum tofieldiae]GKT91760.1 hypothetical protein Ct61P_09610 [Colletotrichum tofieldiae]